MHLLRGPGCQPQLLLLIPPPGERFPCSACSGDPALGTAQLCLPGLQGSGCSLGKGMSSKGSRCHNRPLCCSHF